MLQPLPMPVRSCGTGGAAPLVPLVLVVVSSSPVAVVVRRPPVVPSLVPLFCVDVVGVCIQEKIGQVIETLKLRYAGMTGSKSTQARFL